MIPYVAVTLHDFELWVGSLVGFGLLIAVFTVWPRPGGRTILAGLNKTLDARAARIEAQLRMAEENQAAAQKAHEEAEAEIALAHAEAAQIVERAQGLRGSILDELTATAESDKNRIVSQAREEIETERNRAIMELRSRAADIAVDAAREVLKRTMDEETDRKLIMRALSESSPNGDGRT